MDRRLIAPIFFGLVAVAVSAGYATLFFILPIPGFLKVLIGVAIAAIAVTMLYVLVERKKEMEEEDKDDLGKY